MASMNWTGLGQALNLPSALDDAHSSRSSFRKLAAGRKQFNLNELLIFNQIASSTISIVHQSFWNS